MNQLFNKFKRDIKGIIWLAVGSFIALSLMSFDPSDPSFNTIGDALQVKNYCGYIGSFLSDIMYQMFGVASWVFVLAGLRMSIRSFRGKDTKIQRLRLIWAILLIITSSSLGELYFSQIKFYSGQISVGGVLGQAISSALVHLFNFAGVAVILWSSAIVLVVFYTERPIKDIVFSPLYISKWVFEKAHHLYLNSQVVYEILNILVKPFKKFWFGIATTIKNMWTALFNRDEKVKTELQIENPFEKKQRFLIDSSLQSGQEGRKFISIQEENAFLEEQKSKDDDEVEPITCKLASGSEIQEEISPPKQFSFFPKSSAKQKRKVKLKAKRIRRVENWQLPKLSILDDPPVERIRVDEKEIRLKAKLLTEKFEQFNVGGKVVGLKPGPAVTLFEFKPNIDVKISKITDLADDLCMALSSESVRIIAPIPGRDVVGIETSNSHQESVYLKDIISEEMFWDESIKLPIPLGRQANGDPKVVDLTKMPHMLVAGTTGSGKSVFIVSVLSALLFRHSPKTLRLILVDPKQVDLAIFDNIPHLLMPTIRDPKKAVVALRWAIREMDKRYRSMAKFGARGLEGFNSKVINLEEKTIKEHESINLDLEENKLLHETYYFKEQPYIAIVVEEFGDLMAVDKANVEQGVVRLAQMARACGIHLILAMQSPRKDVVTGLIKTNIPGRISFKVASKLDSRVILDESGGERLLARGDMLFLAPGIAKPERHHGPWLSEVEINSLVNYWREQGEPEYDERAISALDGSGGGYSLEGGFDDGESDKDEYDEMYDQILEFVSEQKSVSASLLQRRFRLGYPRAARIIELMENEGVVGPANGSKPRDVLLNSPQ